MNMILFSLAQVNNLDSALPKLDDDYSSGVPWMIVVAFVVGILAIAFKRSGRSHLDR
jgi:hypothetical protein